MRVLVACEFSGRVRDAFAAVGHDAWSCDLLPSETTGNHIQGDVLEHLDDGWDLMVAHPPCTHLCTMSYCRPQDPAVVQAAVDFAARLFYAPITRVAIENPGGRLCAWLLPSQIIQPTMFGAPYTKKTCLWLRGLPPLFATSNIYAKQQWVHSGTSKKRGPAGNAKARSRTFPGIAEAMALQWGVWPFEEAL